MTSLASAFEIEQKVNRCHRRCVIGKVTKKYPTPFDVWPYLTPPADIWPSMCTFPSWREEAYERISRLCDLSPPPLGAGIDRSPSRWWRTNTGNRL